MTRIVKKSIPQKSYPVGKDALKKILEENGKMPPIALLITPLNKEKKTIYIDKFTQYNYSNSILIPVDQFSFSYAAPDGPSVRNTFSEGDIVQLFANNQIICTGIIDTIEISVDPEYGETVTINGRDLMGQLEDQDAVSINNEPMWGNEDSLKQAAEKLIQTTRVKSVQLSSISNYTNLLFATEPVESKLSALQRLIESLNCLMWTDQYGNLILGRPNMKQKSKGSLYVKKETRESNVLSIKATFASSVIPNQILPIWSGMEKVQNRLSPQALKLNAAEGPSRLRKYGHILTKAVVVSAPDAESTSGLSETEFFKRFANDKLDAYAMREMARANHKELIVQCMVPGHYNNNGEPFLMDQVYQISFDRANIEEDMYLFQVEYIGGEGIGQKTTLYFCKKGTMVFGVKSK